MKKLFTPANHSATTKEPPVAAADSAARLGTILYTFVFAHIFIALVLSLVNTDLYYAYTEEDGYIEYSTAIFLLATSVLCLYKASGMGQHLPRLFFYAAAVIFFLGFGEEISWGQRIIGFATPENLEKINSQDEFNVHNIKLNGVSINQFIFGKVQYTCVFIYFLGFLLLYRRMNRFRNLIDTFKFPIPSAMQSKMYFLAFFSILLVREGDRWELQEFVLTSFLFFVFLFPANKKAAEEH